MDSTLQALIVTLGIVALAGLFALIEALGDRRAWRRREEAERARTTGVFVGFSAKRHRHGSVRSLNRRLVTVYYPIVSFQVDGVEYKLESADIVPRNEYLEGQSVNLLYDSDDPTHFHLDRGDLKEQSTRDAIIIALVWLTGVLVSLALQVCTSPQLGIPRNH